MTFREKAIEMLTSRGMFDAQAEAVVERVVADEANAPMRDRWDDDVAGYPEPMLAVLWFTVRTNAVEWIDEHCPKAWYRPMFAPASEVAAAGESR